MATIDDFSDFDIKEYFGETDGYTLESKGGRPSLKSTNDGQAQIYSSSGLDNYPRRGDTIQVEAYTNTSSGNSDNEVRVEFMFGVEIQPNILESTFLFEEGNGVSRGRHGGSNFVFQNGDPSYDNGESSFTFEQDNGINVGGQDFDVKGGYRCYLTKNKNRMGIVKMDDSGFTGETLIDEGGHTFAAEEWITMEVVWGDPITFNIYSSSGTETVSASDVTYDSGGIGWTYGTGADPSDVHVWYDKMETF